MSTKRLNALTRQYKRICTSFLPQIPNAVGKYSRREMVFCEALIILAHAELETFFEETARYIIDTAERTWKSKRRITIGLATMLAYHTRWPVTPSGSIFLQGADKRTETLIFAAIASHRARIENNHGIRARNISDLFMPLGIEGSDFDEQTMISVDSFGVLRGELAHKTPSKRSIQVPDPFVADKLIRDIITNLQAFETNLIRVNR